MILITGGLGYIGSHVNKYLNQKGFETITVDSLIYGHIEFNKWGKFYHIDINDKEKLRAIFAENQIDAVMHFSAFAYVGESVKNPSKYYNNNLINSLNLLDVMYEFGVKKIIFSSTCATYGEPNYVPIDEKHLQSPINPYGYSKYFVEQIIKDYSKAYEFSYVIFRYFNAAGADPDCEIGEWHNPETHLIPLIFDNAIGKTKEINIFGKDYPTPDGTCIRDYIHVTDIAQAHYLGLLYLLNTNFKESIILNLGNNNGFSVNEVIDTVEKVTNKKITRKYVDRREGDPAILIGSSSLAKEIIGWEPIYFELEVIIKTAWDWHIKLNNEILRK